MVIQSTCDRGESLHHAISFQRGAEKNRYSGTAPEPVDLTVFDDLRQIALVELDDQRHGLDIDADKRKILFKILEADAIVRLLPCLRIRDKDNPVRTLKHRLPGGI